MRPNKIPLELIRVASPCSAAWDEMAGDGRTRYCAHCSQHVYNLSDLTQTQAEALIEEHEGKMCVRYYERPDGTVLTNDCPIGWRAMKRHFAIAGSIAAAVFAVFLGFLTVGVVGNGRPAPLPNPIRMVRDWFWPPVVMGQSCVPTPIVVPPTNPPAPNGEEKM